MPLTAERKATKQKGFNPSPEVVELKVKGATTIYAGSLVVIDAGFAKPGVSAAGLIAVGRAEETVVNAGADGAKTIKVRCGVMTWANATAGDACAQADAGKIIYVFDDATVTKTSTSRSVAGRMLGLDADGQVIVAMGLQFQA
jgi:hypothetical protein